MRRLPDIPVLTPAQEHRLASVIEAGVLAEAVRSGAAPPPRRPVDPADLAAVAAIGRRAELDFLQANLKLIKLVSIRASASSGIPEDDLFQEGFLGMTEALRRFDHRRGVRFASYALPWIRARVGKAVADSGALRVSSRQQLRMRITRAADEELTHRLGREPRTRELADAMGVDPLPRVELMVPLDEAQHTVAAADPCIAEDFAETERCVLPWQEFLDELPTVQQRVLRFRYGFEGEPCSYDFIGLRLGCSGSTVRRIEQRALVRLRRRLVRHGVDSSDAVRRAA